MFRKITNAEMIKSNINYIMSQLDFTRVGTSKDGTGWMWSDKTLVWSTKYIPDWTVNKKLETMKLFNEIQRFKWRNWVILKDERINVREPIFIVNVPYDINLN